MRIRVLSIVVAIVAFGTGTVGYADVPKPEDIAACNKQAQEAVRSGSASPQTASPNTKDHGRAAQAREGGTPTDATGTVTRSPDPQIEGMDAAGAKDPVYQAAFRTCMRKAGF